MKYITDVKQTAEIGILEAYDYYETKQIGLGEQFLDCWEEHLAIIKKNPFLFQEKYKTFRLVLIKPYPYHIVYEIEDNTIIVYKVIYAGRSDRKRYNKK